MTAPSNPVSVTDIPQPQMTDEEKEPPASPLTVIGDPESQMADEEEEKKLMSYPPPFPLRVFHPIALSILTYVQKTSAKS